MHTFNRYIVRLYLTNIVILTVVLLGFIVTVDVFINLGRFYGAAAGAAKAANKDVGMVHQVLLTAVGIVRLWAPRLVQLFAYLNGVILVAAMGFTCAQLVRHREFVALLASGVSLQRVARPFVLVALAMTVVQALDQELLVPAVAPLLVRDAGDSFKDEANPFRLQLSPDGQGRLFHAARFDADPPRLVQPVVWERDSSGRVTRVISGESAEWSDGGWTFKEGRAWSPGAFAAQASGSGGVGPASRATAVDRVLTPLDPTTIKVRSLSSFGEALSMPQLAQVASSSALPDAARERLQRLRWGRIAGWAGNIVTLLAVMPFFLLRSPAPLVGASLKAAPIMAAGLAASAAGAGLALPGLPVWLGAFVPCLILVPIAIALFTGVKT